MSSQAQVYVAVERRLYLDKIPQVASSCLERQVAHVRNVIVPRSVDLQLVRSAHVPVVRAVAGCNSINIYEE